MDAASLRSQQALGFSAAGASSQGRQPERKVGRPFLQTQLSGSVELLHSNLGHRHSSLHRPKTRKTVEDRFKLYSVIGLYGSTPEALPDPEKFDPALWTSEQVGEYLGRKTGVPKVKAQVIEAGISGGAIHTVKASDLKRWGLDPRTATRAYSFLEGLVRRMPVESFQRVHSAMSDEEFSNIVDEASAVFEDLKVLGAKEFLAMKPSEWARFLNSEILRARIESAVNRPKVITMVQEGNSEEVVEVAGQEGLDVLKREGYLVALEAKEGEKRRVDKFWDLRSGHRYTSEGAVSQYQILRRDFETAEQRDAERGMSQAYFRLMAETGATFLEPELVQDTTPRLRRGRIGNGLNRVVAVQGRPMPVAHRMLLRPWTDGENFFPAAEYDAITPVGFQNGEEAIVVGEGKTYAIRKDVMELAARANIFRQRLRAGDPQLTSPCSTVRDKGPYREFSIDLSPYRNLNTIPLMFTENFDPEVKTAALENKVALLSWGGGAVDIVVYPKLGSQAEGLKGSEDKSSKADDKSEDVSDTLTELRGVYENEQWEVEEGYEEEI